MKSFVNIFLRRRCLALLMIVGCLSVKATESVVNSEPLALQESELVITKPTDRLHFALKLENKPLKGNYKIKQKNGYILASFKGGYIDGKYKQVKAGRIAFLIDYCLGRPCGDYQTFFPNGKLAKFKQYNKWNQLDGSLKTYSQANGRILRKTSYQQGKKNGVEVVYFKEGLEGVNIRSQYLNGEKQGEETVYFQEGGVEVRQNYDKDLLHGTHIKFLPDGTKTFQANYKENKYHGNVRMFLDGQLWILKHYQDGKLHGKWIEYDLEQPGATKQIKYFENDKEVAQQGWTNK